MAVITNPIKLNFDICQTNACKYIEFSELTGIYNIDTNPNGWGTPNTLLSTAILAELIIEQPGGVITTLDITDGMGSNGFPTVTDGVIYYITSADLGLSSTTSLSTIPDGLYTITYKVTCIVDDNTIVYKKTKQFFLSCNIKCKVYNNFANLMLCDCDCYNTGKADSAILAFSLYQALCASANCTLNKTKLNDLLLTLQTMLGTTDCGCNKANQTNSNLI